MDGATSEIAVSRQAETRLSWANLLYFCDMPPSNSAGSQLLINRLLAGYPSDSLTILTSSHGLKVSPVSKTLTPNMTAFPTTSKIGRWGIGRLKNLLSWLSLPIVALWGCWVIKQRGIQVIVTLAHGRFFLAAALASWITSRPLILIVHDDWVSGVWHRPKSFLFGWVVRKAKSINVASPYLQQVLQSDYGVEAKLQMPGVESLPSVDERIQRDEETPSRNVRIVYAGACADTMVDSLQMLIQLVKSDILKRYGLQSWELHLYTTLKLRHDGLGWQHDRVKIHEWVSQAELPDVLSTCDILFLPYSFKEDQKPFVIAGFPTKTTDYLASGRSILVFAPGYSSLANYAREFGFAEVVDQPNEDALAKGIYNIWSSKDYREKLRANALAAFKQNHDIVKQRKEFYALVHCLMKS